MSTIKNKNSRKKKSRNDKVEKKKLKKSKKKIHKQEAVDDTKNKDESNSFSKLPFGLQQPCYCNCSQCDSNMHCQQEKNGCHVRYRSRSRF